MNQHGTALRAASASGHEKIAPLLIIQNAAVNAQAKSVTIALAQVHRLRVPHSNAKARNTLLDTRSGDVTVVDSKGALSCPGLPLGVVCGNGQSRKRERGFFSEPGDDNFFREPESALASVSL